MEKFKPKIFAFFLSAGLLLMTAVMVFINPHIFEVIEARAATAGYKAVCIGGCPGAHRGSIPIYAVGGSGSAIGLVTKGYVDNLVLSGGTDFEFTGLLHGASSAGLRMDAGSTMNLAGIVNYLDGATTNHRDGSTEAYAAGALFNMLGIHTVHSGATINHLDGSTEVYAAGSLLNHFGIVTLHSGATYDILSGAVTTYAQGSTLALNGALSIGVGATISRGAVIGTLPMVIKHDTTLVQIASTTEVDGSTVEITLLDASGGLHIACGGTIGTNTNDSKILAVLGGGTPVCTLTMAAGKIGHYSFDANVTVMSATTVISWCSAVIDGFTSTVNTNYLGTTLNISAVTEWTVEMDLASASDTMSMTGCVWTYNP